MKRFLATILIFIILIMSMGSIPVQCQNEEEISFFVSKEIGEDLESRTVADELIQRQGELLEKYQSILEILHDDANGGAFFDEEAVLHVQLAEECADLPDYDGIVYENVKYSIKQLMEYQDLVMEIKDVLGIEASGIRQNLNKIVFYSEDYSSEETIKGFIPEDSFIIEIGEVVNTDCSAHIVRPGKRIVNTSNNTFASVSCGVIWDNSTNNKKYGFMTTGHLGSVGDSVTYLATPMGTITKKQQSGSVDAALILNGQTEHSFYYESTVYDGKTFTYNGITVPNGTAIFAYGATTTYSNLTVIQGNVTDINWSGTFDGISFNSLIKTDAGCVAGDSGGPVLMSYGGSYAIIGIIKGVTSGNMVFCNMINIKNALDLTVKYQ